MRADTAIFVAHDDFVKRDSAEPERNLMRAILRSAMEDMRKQGESYRDARRYFTSNDDFYVYSFLSICYHLDLCPRTIRTVLGLIGAERETLIIVEDSDARQYAERAPELAPQPDGLGSHMPTNGVAASDDEEEGWAGFDSYQFEDADDRYGTR